MPYRWVFLFVLLMSSTTAAAELRTLAGAVVMGDLVSIDAKEIVLQKGGDRIATPLDQVLQLDLAPIPASLPKDVKYTDVLLTDDTLLHCKHVAFKGKEGELTLLADQVVKVPLEKIAHVQNEAHDEKVRKEYRERFLGKNRSRDLLVVRKGEVLEKLEGTLGAADAEGKTMEFILSTGGKYPVPFENIHGLVFLRQSDPRAAPVLCKLHDTHTNLLMASAITQTPNGLTVTTSSGVQVQYPREQVARLDYSKGKLTFLSDDSLWKFDKVRVAQSSNVDRLEPPRRDKNLDGGPIRLGNKIYPRGLALHARTELVFDLEGDYRELKLVAGVNDLVGGLDGPAVLRIEGDGREIYQGTFTRASKPEEILRDIKNVQKLKITVSSGDFLDLGKHLDLGDAKVSKVNPLASAAPKAADNAQRTHHDSSQEPPPQSVRRSPAGRPVRARGRHARRRRRPARSPE